MLGADGDRQQGVIIALAVVADLAHVEAALLRQEGALTMFTVSE